MCKYCNNDYDNEIVAESLVNKKIKSMEVGILLDLSIMPRNMLTLTYSDDYMHKLLAKKINYCPMCGRKLVDKK